MEDDFVFVFMAIGALHPLRKMRTGKHWQRKKRRMWVRPLYQQRATFIAFHSLVNEIMINEPEMNFGYFRMSNERQLNKFKNSFVVH